jgi:hypothetical protein
MSTPVFTPVGRSIVLAYADDSTDTSTEVVGASAFLVYNPDAANVVVVSVGATNGSTDAIVPTSGANGSGVVIGPKQQVVVGAGFAQYSAGSVFISVAGVSGTGNVYITPGSI